MYLCACSTLFFFFFFNDTATTEIYTLSLHDALPIWYKIYDPMTAHACGAPTEPCSTASIWRNEFPGDILPANRINPIDRKSTRLNSSHGYISYAVFCLKKKTI